MLVQWCLKGVLGSSTFGDVDALNALQRDGLTSSWVRSQANAPLLAAMSSAHDALSNAALAAHVNAYATVAGSTPYLSLSAGVVERDAKTRTVIRHRAWTTALDFATNGGRSEGYVFECWIPLPANPAPELPGFGEEVRDLNLHGRFGRWHHQGEVAAKLVVPPRQIRRVMKFSAKLTPIVLAGNRNPHFVPPERISNIRQIV